MSQVLEEIEIKSRFTQNKGTRFVHNVPILHGHWFWDIPKARRPQYTTIYKENGQMYISIWGGSPEEVRSNLKKFHELKKTNEPQQQQKQV